MVGSSSDQKNTDRFDELLIEDLRKAIEVIENLS